LRWLGSHDPEAGPTWTANPIETCRPEIVLCASPGATAVIQASLAAPQCGSMAAGRQPRVPRALLVEQRFNFRISPPAQVVRPIG
jgi:hypothetical protein